MPVEVCRESFFDFDVSAVSARTVLVICRSVSGLKFNGAGKSRRCAFAVKQMRARSAVVITNPIFCLLDINVPAIQSNRIIFFSTSTIRASVHGFSFHRRCPWDDNRRDPEVHPEEIVARRNLRRSRGCTDNRRHTPDSPSIS